MNIYHFEANEEDTTLIGGQGQCVAEALSPETAAQYADAEIISVFVGSNVNKEVFDAMPDLKLVVTRSTGFDHIDCSYAASRNVAVANVPAYGSRTVAEFAMTLILGLSRKAFQANYHIKTGQAFDYAGFEGFNLQGKTLGVIGTGKIGQEIIKISKGFEMNVLAFDAFPNENASKELGFKYTTLEDLQANSDVVTLHVPYNKDTHHLINTENVTKFKQGSILVNTSRGEVIDTTALLTGLEQGIFSGVGLDVLEGEHELKDEMQLTLTGGNTHQDQLKVLLEDHILMDHPKVIITPHMAFFTKEAKAEIVRVTLDNIESFQTGSPKNIVKI